MIGLATVKSIDYENGLEYECHDCFKPLTPVEFRG